MQVGEEAVGNFLSREGRVITRNVVRGAFYDYGGRGCDIFEVGVFVPVPP